MVINANRPTVSIARPTAMNVGSGQSGLVTSNPSVGMVRGPIS